MGVFAPEIIIDILVYGLVGAGCCLGVFTLIVFHWGNGDLGIDSNNNISGNPGSQLVFEARSATFATMVWILLFLAFECMDLRRSLFKMDRTPEQCVPFPWLSTILPNAALTLCLRTLQPLHAVAARRLGEPNPLLVGRRRLPHALPARLHPGHQRRRLQAQEHLVAVGAGLRRDRHLHDLRRGLQVRQARLYPPPPCEAPRGGRRHDGRVLGVEDDGPDDAGRKGRRVETSLADSPLQIDFQRYSSSSAWSGFPFCTLLCQVRRCEAVCERPTTLPGEHLAAENPSPLRDFVRTLKQPHRLRARCGRGLKPIQPSSKGKASSRMTSLPPCRSDPFALLVLEEERVPFASFLSLSPHSPAL